MEVLPFRRQIFVVMGAVCLSLPATVALGQTVGAASGAIIGTVTDRTAGVLSGVSVTISSDALIGDSGTRRAVTDGDGRYRFAALPPGEYTLLFVLDGFASKAREDIYVGVGLTATVDVELDLATLHEQLAVERGSPVIDSQSAAIAVTFDAAQLADLPHSRSIGAIIAATPSVHVTRFEIGGNLENPGLYTAYGTDRQNRPMVEGMSVSGILGTGFTLNYGSFEEVTVGTAAHGAEWPMAGVQMQVIVKSGGNRYRGTVYAHHQDRSWQSFNIDEDQILRANGGREVRETNRLRRHLDLNADIGGFIRKDRAWWYSSIRDEERSAHAVNFPVRPRRTHITNYTGKGTYRLSGNNRLIAFVQTGRNHQPDHLDPFGPLGGSLRATTAIHESEDSTAALLARGRLWKVEWTSVIMDALFVELRAGQFVTSRSERPNGTSPRFEDVGNQRVAGGSRDWRQDLRSNQVLGSLSYLKDGRFGNHHIKLGGEAFRITSAEMWRQGYPGDVLHVLLEDRPREVYLFETPSHSVSGVWLYGAYITDSWQVRRRLTLNLGLRFDRSRVFLPEQEHPAGRFNPVPQRFDAVDNVIDWNVFAPRVGLSQQLTGDGKTFLKFSYAQYWVPPGTDVGANANPNALQRWRRYPWTDLNSSGVWEPGEQGRESARRGGAGVESRDPNLELAYVKEAAGSIERELIGRVGVRTGIVWRGARQQHSRQDLNRPFDAFTVPVAISDPGPDGLEGTADDGPAIQAFDVRPEFRDLPVVNTVRNVPASDSGYWTWEILATRRFNGRWSMTAGFAHTWSRDHASTYIGQPVRNNILPLTPNDLINTSTAGRHAFTTWTAKAYGTLALPGGVRLTPLLRHQSGQPFGRTIVATLDYGAVRILAEPVGARRMDHITIVDLQVKKAFRLGNDGRLTAFVDVFNVLNANPEESAIWSSGPSFLRPLGIVAPRSARLGVKVEW